MSFPAHRFTPLLLALAASGFASAAPAWPTPPTAPKGAPNVVVVLLDDVGFGASSTFGGVSQTPHLDKLASQGLRYNQFHTTALSSPTRASLLTGRNHHQTGFGIITEGANPNPGYNTVWNKQTASIAEILRRNGYSTAGFGKWHNTPTWESSPAGPFDHWPTGLGFEYYYGFLGGETSQWNPPLFRNTTQVEPWGTPEQGYHLTTDITNDAIRWLHTHETLASDKPYFLYFATGATHAPHHVPKEWIEKYRGKFDQGWDQLREDTFARQKQLGVIPADAVLTPRPAGLPAWDSLGKDEKRLYARQAEVFAGFLEHTDHEVGRLLDAVRQGPGGDNTLILFIVGDNGGSPEGGLEGSDINVAHFFLGVPNPVKEQLQHFDELGGPNWDNHFATAWAWATNTPFQWTKQVASHLGGIRNPLVVSWPAGIQAKGELRTQFGHVNDIAPTILDVTGIALPGTVDGVAQLPLEGKSLRASFNNAKAPNEHHVQYFEMLGNRGIYQDGWFASARHGVPWDPNARSDDYSKDTWELYNLNEDFSQSKDLAAQQPERLKALQELFQKEGERNQVFPLANGISTKAILGGKPTLYGSRKEITFYPGEPRLERNAFPAILGAHRFTAQLTIPAKGAEGVILANGGRLGGYSLYVKNGKLVYEQNIFGKHHSLVKASDTLPAGEVEVAFAFTPDSPKPFSGGRLELFVNGQPAGSGSLPYAGFPALTDGFDIGADLATPVSNEYQVPFAFTGTIQQVRLNLP